MRRSGLQLACLVFAALAMGMHLAHALEFHPKLQWGPELYLPVQTSLYRWFGIIGPILEITALLAVGALMVLTRREPAGFPYAATSFSMLVLGLAVWLTVVMPANGGIDAWALNRTPPADWERLRWQWQSGQAGIFLLHLIGFCALALGMLRGAAAPRQPGGSTG